MTEGKFALGDAMSRLMVEHSDDILTIRDADQPSASCKKIQNEHGDWQQIEICLRERTPVEFSHGMCPECMRLSVVP